LSFFRPALLLHAGFETATLNHEAVDDAMKDRVVVVAVAHVLQKVRCSLRRVDFVDVERELTVIGAEFDVCHAASLPAISC